MINKIKKIYNKYEEIIKYIFIGGCTTIVSLGTYYLCVYTFLDPKIKLELQLANIISWVTCVTFAYFTNRSIVFKSKNINKLKEIVTFFESRLLTLIIDMSLMYIFVSLIGLNDKIMKIIVSIIVTILNYIFSKLFVFKGGVSIEKN